MTSALMVQSLFHFTIAFAVCRLSCTWYRRWGAPHPRGSRCCVPKCPLWKTGCSPRRGSRRCRELSLAAVRPHRLGSDPRQSLGSGMHWWSHWVESFAFCIPRWSNSLVAALSEWPCARPWTRFERWKNRGTDRSWSLTGFGWGLQLGDQGYQPL